MSPRGDPLQGRRVLALSCRALRRYLVQLG
jgi:hypothetical protein